MTEATLAVLLCVYSANLRGVNPSTADVIRVSGFGSKSVYRVTREHAVDWFDFIDVEHHREWMLTELGFDAARSVVRDV